MPIPSSRWFCRLVARISVGGVLTFLPYSLELDQTGFLKFDPAAYAKNSGGGKGNSGSGKGDNSKGDSKSNDSSDSNDSGDDAGNADNVSNSSQKTRVNLATGDKVTVRGNVIEVVHPDGISEKIEAGRFSMKDALGRTIIDRAARASDVKRLKAL